MKKCKECGTEFTPKTKKGEFCSPSCKQKDYRKGVAKLLTIARNGAVENLQGRYLKEMSDSKSWVAPITAPKTDDPTKDKGKPPKKIEAKNEPKNAPQLTNEQVEEKIKAIRAEVKPSIIGSRQFELYQEKRIDELKKQLI